MLVLLRFSHYLIFRCEISGPQGKGASPSRTSARRWRGYGDRMMRLADIRIATKIFGVVGLLLVVAVGSGATGIVGLGMMNQATDRIELAGTSMSEGARLNRNVVELNRIEYRLAANPSDATAVADLLTATTSAVKRRQATAEAPAAPRPAQLQAHCRARAVNEQQDPAGT